MTGFEGILGQVLYNTKWQMSVNHVKSVVVVLHRRSGACQWQRRGQAREREAALPPRFELHPSVTALAFGDSIGHCK
jgi:hypothetical protein